MEENKQPQDSESRHADKYIVRFPPGMRDQIAELAKQNNRSMNAEIVARLEESLAKAEASEEQAFQDGFEMASLRIEVEKLKRERLQLYQSRGGGDPIGKQLEQLPAELVSQYGLHLYRAELDRVRREQDEAHRQHAEAYPAYQALLAANAPPGPIMRSKEAVSALSKRAQELENQAVHLKQTISNIHIYREAHGLPEIRDVHRVIHQVTIGSLQTTQYGTPSVIQSLVPPEKLKILPGDETHDFELKPPPREMEGGEAVKTGVSAERPRRYIRNRRGDPDKPS